MFHSKQWHYSLHRDFQKVHSTQRNPGDSSNSTFYSGTHPELHTPCRRQRALHPVQNPILHIEGKEIFNSSYKTFQRHSRHSSHRTFQRHSQIFQTFQSFMTFSLSRQYFMFQYLQGFRPITAFSN